MKKILSKQFLLAIQILFVGLIVSSCDSGGSTNVDQQNPEDPSTLCEGTYPCNNVEMLGHLTPEELMGDRLNDIWGWTDPQTGKEYALVGLTDGVTFVDISTPSEPKVVGKLLETTHNQSKSYKKDFLMACGINLMQAEGYGTQQSVWRDFKVYQNHLYVVSDGQDHGMQVFNLTKLRDVTDPPATFEQDLNYDQLDNAHNIFINEETGFAYTVGGTQGEKCADGGLHMIDINDPMNPAFAGCFAEKEVQAIVKPGYVHDAQCVVYDGPDVEYAGEEVCFNASETALVIAKVGDKNSPETISFKGYEGASYTHQGWLTEDHRYYLMDDELDEMNTVNKTSTYIWDVSDLDNPELIGTYEAKNNSIDHNQYIKGNYSYQANYTSGLRILDITDISSGTLEEVAFFDTYPADNETRFNGAWSNYPYFESGVVIVSDINNGLFILSPTLN